MKKNIGLMDRVLRLVIAIVLAGLALRSSSLAGKILLVLGSLFCVYEASMSWCALYALLGMNTCPITPPAKKDPQH